MAHFHHIRTVCSGVHRLAKKRTHWKTHLGFLFAAIGSAVGLGNIWRFSYVAGQHGGGAFLIPYLIVIFLFGIPLLMLELAAGKRFRNSTIPTLQRLHRWGRSIGFIAIAGPFVILTYYTVVLGWTLAYALFFLINRPMAFSEFTHTLYPVVFFVLVVLGTAWLVSRGIQRGIEQICKITIPLLYASLLILLIRALMLPNAFEGILFFLTPSLEAAKSPSLWLAAIGQAFFSLSIGYGVYLTYASYENHKDSIPLSAMVIGIADTLVAFLAGLMIFAFVFAYGIDPRSGPELAFVVFPKIFGDMTGGNIFAVIFFLVLFAAGLGATLSMIEVVAAGLIDACGYTRKKAVELIAGLVLLLGLPSALSYAGYKITLAGKPFLDAIDWFTGTYYLPFSALLLYWVIAWKWKPQEYLRMINDGHWHIPPQYIFWIQWVIPVVLAVLLIRGVGGA